MIHLWLLSTFCYLALNFGATCIHIPDAGCWKQNKKCYLPDKSLLIDCVVPENIHTPPTEGFLVWNPHPHPSGNSILVSYFPSKNRAFESLLPLGISVNLPWGRVGMDIFWNYTLWIAFCFVNTYPLGTVGVWTCGDLKVTVLDPGSSGPWSVINCPGWGQILFALCSQECI